MNILIICGSPAEKSYTKAGLQYIEGLLNERGAFVQFWDLREQPLPIVAPEYHKNPFLNPEKTVRDFCETVRDADGIILGTPLYHGSYSGVLKNALDNLASDAFHNKPVGLLSNGTGGRGTTVPCEHLRGVVRAMSGYTTQTQVATGTPDFQEKNGTIVLIDEQVKKRCTRFVEEILQLIPLLKNLK